MAEALKVVYWDDPILSTVCDPVEENEFGPKLEEFAQQLLKSMDDRNGIGLAAPQVGVAKRMFAMHFPEEMNRKHKSPLDPIVVCNPSLELKGATVYDREGCLSTPGVFEQVARAQDVWMQCRRPNGDHIEVILTNFNARVAQHEFDHLNGVMFFNYLDIRPTYGRRMSKQLSKHVQREWDKERAKRGI